MNIKLDIPEDFYRGEERCGYYVSPEMKKVWAVELDLIAEFARVCEKYNIKFYMDGGTLLGAVRHKGFIPWDDDVDILLMREDYNKLLEIAPKEFKQPYFFCSPSQSGEGRMMTFSKLFNASTTLFENIRPSIINFVSKTDSNFGIYLDVFPLDDLPDDKETFMNLLSRLRKLINTSNKLLGWTNFYYPAEKLYKRPIKAMLHYICKIMKLSHKPSYNEFMKLLNSISYPDSKNLAKFCTLIFDSKFIPHRIWPRSAYYDVKYLDFEMLSLPAPAGYEEILNIFYGNWHEYFIRYKHGAFYDTEHSYKYYLKEGHPINEAEI